MSLEKLNIAVATKNHHPSILAPDFFKYSRIVPDDWELARQPIVIKQASQFIFKNTFSMVDQPQVLKHI